MNDITIELTRFKAIGEVGEPQSETITINNYPIGGRDQIVTELRVVVDSMRHFTILEPFEGDTVRIAIASDVFGSTLESNMELLRRFAQKRSQQPTP